MLYGPLWTINAYHLLARDCVEPQSKGQAVPPSSAVIVNIK